ncbi:GGDEF domain-containing protein, partial [Candidatus Gracilibacteria bacterium]|nr:GGDEF domain-containing protein [Candidatus Gracilibacteria bacterium]
IVEVINKAMLKFLGFVNEKKIIGKILEKIVMSQIKIDKKLMKKLLKFFNKVIESKKGIKFRTKFKNKHGKDIYISIAIEPKIKNDEVIQFVCTVRDVTLEEYKKKKLKEVRKKLRETNKKLEDLSAKDWLTKVYNKRKFDEILLKEVTRSIRYNNNLSLLMIDLDYFKKINDNYGHLIGDRVLKKIAELSKMSVRDDIDAVARYGGEEFVIILPETRLEDATKVAEKIRKKIEEIKFDFEPTLKQTVSIGVTSLYESSLFSMSTKKIKKLELKKGSENLKKFYEEAFYLLVKDADKKLYKAKGEGRNRVVS